MVVDRLYRLELIVDKWHFGLASACGIAMLSNQRHSIETNMPSRVFNRAIRILKIGNFNGIGITSCLICHPVSQSRGN
jgi:hypothetical protein